MEKKEKPKQQQSWFNWNTFFWIMLLLLALNVFVYPNFGQPTTKDTDYATFISYVDQGKVSKVLIKDDVVYFTVGKENFKTAEVNDPQLVDRLIKAKSPNKSGHIEFTKTLPQKNSPLLDFIIWWILPAVIFFGLWQWGAKRVMKGGAGGGGFLSLGKSGAKVYAETDIKTTFDDVAGQDEAKATLKEIVDFLHNPQKYTRLGAKLPKGALLVGPPGTGKTLIARAVAGEAHVPFFSISGS